jgi:hypothetical protein
MYYAFYAFKRRKREGDGSDQETWVLMSSEMLTMTSTEGRIHDWQDHSLLPGATNWGPG